MQTYCKHANYKKHTDNICPKKLIIANKKIKGKSKCADCITNKSFHRKKCKAEWNIIVSGFLIN